MQDSAGDVDAITDQLDKMSVKEKPLVILDLNGFLVFREYKKLRTEEELMDEVLPDGVTRLKNHLVRRRPGISAFLEFVFANFEVAVWSSVSRYNIDSLVRHVMPDYFERLAFVWCQDQCERIEQPDSPKPLFLKNLVKVWQEQPEYNGRPTLMIDDDSAKMKNNPESLYLVVKKWKGEDSNMCCDRALWLALLSRMC